MVDRNKNEALKVNVYGTKNLLEVLEKRGKNLVFFPSTSHVYKYSKKRISENHLLRPSSFMEKQNLKLKRL